MKTRQFVLPALALLFFLSGLVSAESTQEKASCEKANELAQKLKTCPYKIMYESFRDNNWELITMNADGSNPVNITKTPDINEIYPHVSPDGTKVVFVSDEGKGIFTHRSVYYMNIDGTERVKVADNARQPCWRPDGKVIAYMKGPAEGEAKYYPNKGLYFYDMATGKRAKHPNDTLENFVNLCYSPDGKWIMCTVVGALGYGQSILAVQVDGNEVVNLIHQARAVTKTIMGCRPDVSPKGDKIAWAVEDEGKMMWIETADLIYEPVTEGGIPKPKAVNYRHMVSSPLPDNELYHADWAPDNELIAYTKGPEGSKMAMARYIPGQQAPGWNICVVDSENPGAYVEITTDGLSNKEPDWYIPQASAAKTAVQSSCQKSCPEKQALMEQLKSCKYKIIYESCRNNNWELITANADGSNPVNITNTPDINEIYPHVSPDGSKIVFVSDEGKGIFTHRSVYYMNIDGTERVKVADNARQPCWRPDGKVIAYMKGLAEGEVKHHPNKGLYFYDMTTGKRTKHPNDTLENFANLSYSPDGKWIMCTVGGALGYGQSILAVQVDGNEVVNLIHQARAVTKTIMGCRPDVSPKGDKITWAVEDEGKMMWIETADLIYAPVTEGGIPMPKAVNYRHMVSSPLPDNELYHADWAPDNELIAYTKGPEGSKMAMARYIPGQQAPGWNICVLDSENPGAYVEITTDGLSNKEPDWYIPQASAAKAAVQSSCQKSCPEKQALMEQLKSCKYKIIYESCRNNNWELITANADGSNPVNITNTPDINEIYPHVSPDGSKIVFVSDEGKGIFIHRSVYYMNIDGTERVKVADNARQPCWRPDGKVIAYMKGSAKGEVKHKPNKGLYFYDMTTGKRAKHPNDTLENFANLSYSPDGKWIMCTVGGALGYAQTILAVQVDGNEVVNLIHQARAVTKTIMGCRPDVSPKGDKITWAVEDAGKMMWIEIADLIYAPVTEGGIPKPKAVNYRHMASSPLPGNELYHADWAPDNRLITFSKGPEGGKMEMARYVLGQQALGWNICVVDSENPGTYVEITTDGLSNKEPDWYIPQASAAKTAVQDSPCCPAFKCPMTSTN